MKHLNKIFSIVLTAAIMTSLLITSAIPVSAAAQAWDKYATPSTTGMVLNTNIQDASVFAQSPVDGALYAAVMDNNLTVTIFESGASGAKATATVNAAGAVTAFVITAGGTGYTAAATVTIAGAGGTGLVVGAVSVGGTTITAIAVTTPGTGYGSKLLKSTDGGRTWSSITTAGIVAPVVAVVPSKTEANVVFIATATTLYKSVDGGATFSSIVGSTDGITALDVATWGGRYIAVVGTTTGAGVYFWDEIYPFNNLVALGSTTFGSAVNAVALAPTFGTDRALVAVGANGVVSLNVNGGAWGATIANSSVGANTAADIAFPSDFNVTTSAVYFVASAGQGLYKISGATATSVDAGTTWNNVSVSGGYNTGLATILVGSSVGTAKKSSNSGTSFSAVSLRSNAAGETAWVLLDRAFATSTTAFILNIGAIGGAFNVATDGKTFNQWSLVNEVIDFIDDLAIASNGDMFMITRNTATVASVAAILPDYITVTSTASGPAAAAAVKQVDTVTPTSANSTTYIISITPTGGSAHLYVYTSSAAANATEICDAFRALINADASNGVVATGTATLILTADVAGVATGFTTVDAGTGTLGIVNTAAAANTVLATTIDVFTFTVTAGSVTVTGAGAGVYAVGGPYTVTFATVAQTSVLEATVTAAGVTVISAGAPGAVQTDAGTNNSAMTFAGAYTLTDVATALIPSNATSKIWRYFGGVWERVALGITGDMIRVSPAGDAVFYTLAGSVTKINVSTDNASKFTSMPSAPSSAVQSLYIVDKDTVIVGGANGKITKNTLVFPYAWTNVSAFGAASGLTVTDIKAAGNGDLYGVATAGNVTKVAQSTDGGVTWAVLKAVGAPTATEASIAATTSNAFLGLSDGQVFVAVDGGAYRFVAYNATSAATGFNAVMALTATPVSGVAVVMGAGNDFQGNGAIFVGDSNNPIVSRILGTTIAVENTLPVTGLGSDVVNKIFAVGNTLWVVGAKTIYNYTDTLVTPVVVNAATNIATGAATSTATINWTLLTNATGYRYAVVTTPLLATSTLPAGTVPTLATTTSVTLTGLPSNTTHYVYVWATDPVDSFMGMSTFVTPALAPATPVGLAPAPAAVNIPVIPSFQWAPVAGATSYELWLDTNADFSTATKVSSAISAYAWAGAALDNGTVYYWQVRAVTALGTSAWVTSVFTTVEAAAPPVTVTSTTSPNITLTQLPAPDAATPGYIWIIIAIGGILTILVIVLIVRTRRVV